MPVSRAMSPPMCGWTYRLAIFEPNSRLRTSDGTLKLTRPTSLTGIDDDDVAAAAADVHQRAHQPRMVRRRVAADEEEQVGVLDVVEGDGGGAGAERLARPTPLA